MKRAFILVFALFVMHSQASASVFYQECEIDGVCVSVISVDLRDKNVKVTPVVSLGLPFAEEQFMSFICRARPLAAINGTYFNMETSTPVGEVTIGGKKINSSGIGTVLAITKENGAFFFDAKKHKSIDRSRIEMTLGAGPRLLKNGALCRDYRREGFKDPHIFQEAIRSGVGITSSRSLMLAISRRAVTLERWGCTLRNLGCADAMNLDGGGSTALCYKGVMLATPTRKLSNILAVYYDSAQ